MRLIRTLVVLGVIGVVSPALAQIPPPRLPDKLYPLTAQKIQAPTTIVAGATWSSGVLYGIPYLNIQAGVTSTQGGVLTINRFMDERGNTLVDSHTSNITANTPRRSR